MSRHFSLPEFGRFLASCEVRAIPAPGMAAEAAADVLYDNAFKVYGDVSKLAPLAKSTQDERERLGFSPNDPLYRDGSKLRAHLEKDWSPEGIAGIGSADEAQKAHEFGFINARTHTAVPPRPVMKIAASESLIDIREIAAGVLGWVLGASKPKLKKAGP